LFLRRWPANLPASSTWPSAVLPDKLPAPQRPGLPAGPFTTAGLGFHRDGGGLLLRPSAMKLAISPRALAGAAPAAPISPWRCCAISSSAGNRKTAAAKQEAGLMYSDRRVRPGGLSGGGSGGVWRQAGRCPRLGPDPAHDGRPPGGSGPPRWPGLDPPGAGGGLGWPGSTWPMGPLVGVDCWPAGLAPAYGSGEVMGSPRPRRPPADASAVLAARRWMRSALLPSAFSAPDPGALQASSRVAATGSGLLQLCPDPNQHRPGANGGAGATG